MPIEKSNVRKDKYENVNEVIPRKRPTRIACKHCGKVVFKPDENGNWHFTAGAKRVEVTKGKKVTLCGECREKLVKKLSISKIIKTG